jgi:NAD(P)-dependent dehydrogenase (short-subunit alcohol dehydrogenase family)
MEDSMEHLRDKVAFITGAASGIGFGIARACLGAGMKLVITDVRKGALESAAASLAVDGNVVLPLVLDVTDRKKWVACADRVRSELGGVDLLCSNAGVNFVGPMHEATYEDWDFALGVNLGGAINAVRTFASSMSNSGRGGHIVITSSVSGLFSGAGAGVYVTSKFALVGLAESLRADLQESGVGVSVLCPGPVQSQLFESTQEVRPAEFAASGSMPVVPTGTVRADTPIFRTAPTGAEIGEYVLQGVRRNDLYILTHPEIRPVLEARAAALLRALPTETVSEARILAESRLLDSSLYGPLPRCMAPPSA